jgi:broad specificity phosphatase PhoE
MQFARALRSVKNLRILAPPRHYDGGMEAPAITRRRRPFLAPIWLPALAVLLFAALGVYLFRCASTTTVVVVRHAEKAFGTIDDPPLSPEGEQRSERLARMFGERTGAGRLDAVYVTNTRRTQQTAAPLAARLHLVPVVLPATDVGGSAGRMLREHRGGTVLWVGHSNTLPQLVRELSGEQVEPIPEDDYGEIYVLSVPRFGSASLVRLKY